jgi:hypothetical protein
VIGLKVRVGVRSFGSGEEQEGNEDRMESRMKAHLLMIAGNGRNGWIFSTGCELSVHKFTQSDWSNMMIPFEERQMMKRSNQTSSNSVWYPNFHSKEFLRRSRNACPSIRPVRLQKITHFAIGNQG